jgi:tRNA 5-methylaminomethyl-2-thiouridine biosynthesis bifunctional protein
MNEPLAVAFLNSCELPKGWGDKATWSILETRFDGGLGFLAAWHAWREDPRRPQMLHFVSITDAVPTFHELLASAAVVNAELAALANELAPHWFGLLPGFHRISFDNGRVTLTLCVGEVDAMLSEQRFAADSIFLHAGTPTATEKSEWDEWRIKSLARSCRRGTRVAMTGANARLCANLSSSGFVLEGIHKTNHPACALSKAEFNPHWVIKNTRGNRLDQAAPVGTCAVIGAGLSGASVAAALARRGWQVTVLDRWREAAGGASGLPVGLAVPHVSIDDCVLSRPSRAGVRLVLEQARQLLCQGQDWDATGTLEERTDGSPGLPANWPAEGREWSHTAAPSLLTGAWRQSVPSDQPALWHQQAAWLKPAQLVRAWLAIPGITFTGGAQVATIAQQGDKSELFDARGNLLASVNRVVFANAGDAVALLKRVQVDLPNVGVQTDKLPAMTAVHGQLSWAMHAASPSAAFPPFPVNGSGSLIPQVPIDVGCAWFSGSSYQTDTQQVQIDEAHHGDNLERLRKLIPGLARSLAPQFSNGTVNAWRSIRCVSTDRLPLVGPLYVSDQPGLWICAGMGSRGLTFSTLCAELLAARWCGEPSPIEQSLARCLRALRASTQATD